LVILYDKLFCRCDRGFRDEEIILDYLSGPMMSSQMSLEEED
jgi:hypothetical protein